MFNPRSYQVEGEAFLSSRNAILAWEPGVGKTFAAFMGGRAVGGPQLYLCPANLRSQVADAAAVFDPALHVQILREGTDKLDRAADIVVSSYGTAAGRTIKGKQDTRVFKQLFKHAWGSIACDEAHGLKEPDARRTRAIYGATPDSPGALFRRARFTWALTGTPVLANPVDLWTHYSRLFPFAVLNDDGDPLTRAEWIDRFCTVRKTGFGDQITGGKNLEELRELIAPFMQVLRSVDVLDLPPLTIDTIHLDAGTLLRGGVPDDAQAQIRALIEADEELGGLQDSLATERRLIALGKAKAVAEQALTELQGGLDKVIIYGHHTEALALIERELSEMGMHPALYRGGMTDRTKEHHKARFIRDATCRAFVGNIVASGTGLDGLQEVCGRILFAEADWTPGINDQCIRRAWRSGQSRPCRVSFCSLRGSIDEDVQTSLTRKAKTIAKII